MCVNALGYGACHIFILFAGCLSLISAVMVYLVGGGCSTLLQQRVDAECSGIEKYLFFQMNGWSFSFWLVQVLVSLQKEKKERVMLYFSPFVLMLVGMAVQSLLQPIGGEIEENVLTDKSVFIFSNLAMFAVAGYSYRIHVEPSTSHAVY